MTRAGEDRRREAAGDRASMVLDAKRYGTVLVGDNGRVVRLTEAGAAALDAPPPALARRLVDAGLAHPVPESVDGPDVTIVVPVKDRPEELDRCLEAAGPALVVDDGSADPAAIAAVAQRHGARLIRRPLSGGPARARNDALAACTTELVAFLDSDTAPPPRWIEALAGHFDDPRVAAVAPRIEDPALDMGARPAQVMPGGRVNHVPSAALLVRRAALGGGFDPGLRYGEDVDLVWRLHDRGWTVRYDPRVTVEHEATSLIRRRFRYGTSAAPLAQRHPQRLAPFLLPPVPTAILALLLARRPRLAALLYAAQTARLATRLNELEIPLRLAPLWTARAVIQTATGIVKGHPAYRAGVLAGAIAHRTLAPLTPQRPRKDALPGPRSRNDRIAHEASSVANSSPTASGTIESAPRIPELT